MKKHILMTGLLAVLFGLSMTTDVRAQDRPADTEVRYNVRFAKGKSDAVYKKRIRLGTSHIYTLRAREGQDMTVILTTGNRTSFTIYSPTEGIIEDADGETMWRGMLNESGEYVIAIGTDKTANYTLEIYIR